MSVKLILSDLQFLVVDDSTFMRRLIVTVLKGFGARHIIEAQNGLSALDAMRANNVDIAIIDWEMPEMSGFEVLKAVQSGGAAFGAVRIILLTAHTQESRVLSAMRTGAAGFLCKPVSARRLYDGIVTCVLGHTAISGDKADRAYFI